MVGGMLDRYGWLVPVALTVPMGAAATVPVTRSLPRCHPLHFTAQVPDRAGPGPCDPSSMLWMYHSHIDETAETYAGVAGGIIVTAKGERDSPGRESAHMHAPAHPCARAPSPHPR